MTKHQALGAAANFTIAERIKDLFDRAKFSSIIFDAASGPAQVTPASPEPYYQTQLTATFEAYLDYEETLSISNQEVARIINNNLAVRVSGSNSFVYYKSLEEIFSELQFEIDDGLY